MKRGAEEPLVNKHMKVSRDNIVSVEQPAHGDFIVERGDGVYFFGEDGTKILPEVCIHRPLLRLMEKLLTVLPKGMDQFGFFTTGGEAVEMAVKVAKAYTGRDGIVVFQGGYHGRNMGAQMFSGAGAYRGYGHTLAGVHYGKYPYCHRCVMGTCKGHTEWEDYMEDIFRHEVNPKDVACILIEPVLGSGGIVPPPAKFMQYLRKKCDDNGIVFIIDEIMAGACRTGKFWAFEHFDVVPDIITCAKGMSNGYPLSMMILKHEIGKSDKLQGTLGSTYSGNVLGCVAAGAVLDIMTKEDFLKNVNERGEQLRQGLEKLKSNPKYKIAQVRGLGLMNAVEFYDDKEGIAQKISEAAWKEGLSATTFGQYETIAIVPPLIINEQQVKDVLEMLEKAIQKVV